MPTSEKLRRDLIDFITQYSDFYLPFNMQAQRDDGLERIHQQVQAMSKELLASKAPNATQLSQIAAELAVLERKIKASPYYQTWQSIKITFDVAIQGYPQLRKAQKALEKCLPYAEKIAKRSGAADTAFITDFITLNTLVVQSTQGVKTLEERQKIKHAIHQKMEALNANIKVPNDMLLIENLTTHFDLLEENQKLLSSLEKIVDTEKNFLDTDIARTLSNQLNIIQEQQFALDLHTRGYIDKPGKNQSTLEAWQKEQSNIRTELQSVQETLAGKVSDIHRLKSEHKSKLEAFNEIARSLNICKTIIQTIPDPNHALSPDLKIDPTLEASQDLLKSLSTQPYPDPDPAERDKVFTQIDNIQQAYLNALKNKAQERFQLHFTAVLQQFNTAARLSPDNPYKEALQRYVDPQTTRNTAFEAALTELNQATTPETVQQKVLLLQSLAGNLTVPGFDQDLENAKKFDACICPAYLATVPILDAVTLLMKRLEPTNPDVVAMADFYRAVSTAREAFILDAVSGKCDSNKLKTNYEALVREQFEQLVRKVDAKDAKASLSELFEKFNAWCKKSPTEIEAMPSGNVSAYFSPKKLTPLEPNISRKLFSAVKDALKGLKPEPKKPTGPTGSKTS